MQKARDFIHNFFKRYSYTTKTNFIFLVGNLPLILMLMMTYGFIYKPMQQIKTQLEGISLINRISRLMIELIDSPVGETSSSSPEQSDEEVLKLIQNQLDDRTSHMENKKAVEILKLDFSIFQNNWHQLHKFRVETRLGVEHQLLVEAMVYSYRNLVIDLAYIYELMTVRPPILRGLVMMSAQDFSRVQRDVFKVASSYQEPASLEFSYQIFSRDLAELEQDSQEILNSISKLYPQIVMDNAQKKLSRLYNELKEKLYRHEEYTEPAVSAKTNLAPQNWAKDDSAVEGSPERAKRPLVKEDLAGDAHPELNEKFSNSLEIHSLIIKSLQNSISARMDLWNILAKILEMQLASMQKIFWVCILTFVIGELGALMIFSARLLRHPLCELVQGANMLEKGNLSKRMPIKTKDEVAELTLAFNALADYYEKILKTATGIIHKIYQASSKISDLAKIIESNMSIQEQMINQISQHSKSIQTEVKEHARLINDVNREAAGTYMVVQQGYQHLHGMESVMHEMLNSVKNVVVTLSSLREKITDINKVISTIVKIADQSNLLSLNTVIRAKKSGSEGRGFVVIADKIQEMADQIATATLDFEDSVQDMIGEVQETVTEVDNLSSYILTQFKETGDISEQLKQLIDSTQQQMREFEKINEGMQGYTKQEEAINLAINDLELNIQVTAFSVHKLFLEIEYLHDASQNLQEKTQKFIFSP